MNSASAKQKILVVDDAPSSLILMESVLEECGAEVFLAKSTDEARAVLHDHDIALIYLDIMMPDMSGYQFAKEIHDRPESRYVPIIFVTAQVESNEEVLKSYRAGVVDILRKPIEPEIVNSKTSVFLQLDKQRHVIEEQQKELKSAFEQLQNYAKHDQLTGLYNREQITNILARIVLRGKRNHDSIAVMFLDLDHFKVVNDSYGHDAGDMLLRSISNRLKLCIRDEDYVARLGGDEFCVVLTDLQSATAAGKVAQRILEALSKPHKIHKHEILISTSIGIAIFEGEEKTANELLKNADAAMYLAKNKGRSQYAYFSQELEAEAIMRIELGMKLKQAIENNELETYYQAQFSAKTNLIIGFEALMRWHVDGKMISPVLFISIAEESGLIKDLGQWILRDACKQLKKWQDEKRVENNVTVSVNISSRQLQFDDFYDSLQDILKESELPPACLELELTESAVMSDPDRCIALFNQVHHLGTRVSVDDFGTGYSSLVYLSSLPLDSLKIDRSFVSNIIEDHSNQTIVKSIISLSHNLGLQVVAEGVETEEQKVFLEQNQCDVMQGFLFSKPIPAVQVEELL